MAQNDFSGVLRKLQSRDTEIGKALRLAKRQRVGSSRSATGALRGTGSGRADNVMLNVRSGSHVIPADVVSAIGKGNSLSGHSLLEKAFPGSSSRSLRGKRLSKMAMKSGGTVPVAASDGEFIVSPEDVSDVGNGDAKVGHSLLNQFIKDIRDRTVNSIINMGEPK